MSNASVCIAQSSRNYQEISEFREGIKESNAFFKTENRLESKVLLDSLFIPFFTLDDSLITMVGFDLGESYSKLGDFEAAAKIFETVIYTSEITGDTLNLTRGLYELAFCYKSLGLNTTAMETLLRCMVICEISDDQLRLAPVLNQIGLIKKGESQHIEAIAYFERSLKIAESTNDSEHMAKVYNNIGSAFKLKGDYSRAKEYLLKAIAINKQNDSSRALSYNYNNLANVFEEQNDLENALDYQEKSIEIKKQIGDPAMLAISYSNLAIIYAKMGKTSIAEDYMLEAIRISEKESSSNVIPIVYKQYADLLISRNKFEQAVTWLNRLVDFKDSAANTDRKMLTKAYATHLSQRILNKEHKLTTQIDESDNKDQNWLLIALLSICFVMLFTVFVLYFSAYRKQAKVKNTLLNEKKIASDLRVQLKKARLDHEENLKKIESAERDKGVFFSTVSHDMRGPLNAINAIVSMLKKQAEDESKEEMVVLDYSVRSLIALTDDILDFSYIESGRLRIEHKRFSLKPLINDMLEAFEFISKEKEIDLIAEIDDLPDKLIGDPRRLKQVLFNLLQNAFKFTREGFVKIKLFSIEHDLNHQRVIIEIQDTGIGISKIRVADIFDKFFQINPQDEIDNGGSGLGLYVSKALIEQMAGTLSVESKINEGSTFKIELILPIAHQI
jgi:signal transduction histidine kinase